MGYQYTNAVLDTLSGKYFEEEIINPKTGKSTKRSLSAYEMALLLVVAARQADPGVYHNDDDPIWCASEQMICDLVHYKKSKLYEARNFLTKLGLLQYTPSERHMDYRSKDPTKMRIYTNVYRIGIAKLMELEQGDELHNTETCPRIMESALRNTETQTVLNKQSKKINSDDVIKTDSEFLENVLTAISETLQIPRRDLLPKIIATAVIGKFPDSVFKTIRKPAAWILNADHPVKALVSVLKKLPLQENDPEYQRKYNPTVDQVLEDASPDLQYLVKTAIKNTGYNQASFAKRLLPILNELVYTKERKSDALETIDKYRLSAGEKPMIKAIELLEALSSL